MDKVKQFLAESPIASKVKLTTKIVIHRLKLTPDAAGKIMESGAFSPPGGGVCELEVGGQCIARGRIVRKRGGYFFKVTEMPKGDAQ
jgi:hypothetical protein